MAGIKIVNLPSLGRDLASTDLFELSLAGGTGSRKITGQEIMNASKLSVGNTPIVNGTVGQLLFQGAGNVLGENTYLFWDNASLNLGIGTNTPSYRLDVAGNARVSSLYSTGNVILGNGNVWMTDGYAIGDYGTGNNRIEFYSSRLSFFGNGNEALRIVGSTRNVLIGTTTDAGYKLDVNGTARVQGNTTFGTLGSGTGMFWDNTNNRLGVGTATPGASIEISNGHIRLTDAFSLQWGSQNNRIFNQANATVFINNANETMRINTTGNVGIGTSSPFGKLDVRDGDIFATITSNANLRSKLTYQGLYVSRSTDGTYTENIISTSSAWLYSSRNSHSFFRDGTNLFTVGSNLSGSGMNINSNGNVFINTTTDAGFKLDVNGTARFQGNTQTFGINRTQGSLLVGSSIVTNAGLVGIDQNGTSSASRIYMADSSGNYPIIINAGGFTFFNVGVGIGTNTDIASAQLHVTSTTKGFLPPRMTQAQRNAIASPAIGLEIYQTDATEGKYIYKSSGWTYIG